MGRGACMSNKIALELLAKSREFDEKYQVIIGLTNMLGSFILYALPMSMRSWKDRPHFGPSMMRRLPPEFGKSAITIQTLVHKGHGLEVVFGFRERCYGDPIISKASFDLELVRYLYDNLDIFVQMAEGACQKYEVLPDFQKQMARFGVK